MKFWKKFHAVSVISDSAVQTVAHILVACCRFMLVDCEYIRMSVVCTCLIRHWIVTAQSGCLKSKIVLVQAMKAYRGSGSVNLLIFSLGSRCSSVVGLTPRPLFPRFPLNRRLSGLRAGLEFPVGIRTPDISSRSLVTKPLMLQTMLFVSYSFTYHTSLFHCN
jgi:hypothetical protein